MTTPGSHAPEPGVFALAGAVFAQRDGKILILKRAGGALSGAWYVPGGGVDAGEYPEEATRRELMEEAGLVPSGELTLIGAVPMHVYGRPTVQFVYACDVPEGDVVVSHEHAGFRWIEPREFRDRYFGEAQIAKVAEGDARAAAIVAGVRRNLDEYIAWLDHAFEVRLLRNFGLTVDAFLVRDGRFLVLERVGNIGGGLRYLPGGVVDRGEQPLAAVLREVREETGFVVDSAELLRTWSWSAQFNRDAYHSLYVAQAPAGEPVLSHEHSAYEWVTPEAYLAYLAAVEKRAGGDFGSWFAAVRENVALVAARIAADR